MDWLLKDNPAVVRMLEYERKMQDPATQIESLLPSRVACETKSTDGAGF